MTDFSERLAALSPEQRALFDLRRKQKGLNEAQEQAIPRRKPAPHYPLSFDQMRLWFLYQLAPENSAYNINGGVRLTGPINIEVLERSINEIIRRHEILRTTIGVVDEQPVQIVAPRLTIKVTLADISDLSGEEQAAEMRRLATQFAQIPFDLVNGPLIRATLLRLAAEDHILITTMHHIVTDRWSYSIFEQELAILYHAFSNRLPSPLPELPIQFADFAIWQQQWMQSEKMRVQLDYWKRQLADLPPVHGIPTDRPRPVLLSFRGARQYVELDSAGVAGIKALSKQSGATIFTTLLTIFKVLLARQSGQTDIVVGTPIANRGRPELEKLIGFFLNTLIFRSDLSGNPTFREYLAQVREIASAAYAHQDVPFEQLVEVLRPERDTSRNPLFQISFLYLDFEDPQELSQLQGMKVKAIDIEAEDARFDLTFALWSASDKIYGFFEYSTDLFEHPTIAAFAEHFKLLAAQIAADPDQRVFDIPCLTDAEQQMLVECNATALDYPQDRCAHQLIETQAARTPNAVAVVFADRSLTYEQLNTRANQLAHHLRALGVGPETRVAVYLHRSPDLVVALLGILKAGSSYVPLDPSYPAARLQFMLEDSAIRVLVTQETLIGSLPAHGGATICLDRDWTNIAEQPPTTPQITLNGSNLAYVIYTSGSTGQPKGVMIPHRALVNFLHSMRREPGIQPDDTLLAVTTIAFDIAGLELFLPLLAGAKLVLVSRDEAADGARLAALLHTSGATIMQATPATWRLLLAAGWAGTPRLRALCGGEALPWDLAETLLERVAELWNLYGPTETTIWSAAMQVRREDRRISLGCPVANTQLYVLDQQMRPVPGGAPGELCIGGHGLARGYFHRPDLTAERFVPDPFAQFPGSRLYKTGDRTRLLPRGTIEFLGRVDHQVKLRGFRIELGEIEAVLRQHEAVREAAVLLRDERLVAYVVAHQEPRTKNQEPGAESSPSPAVGLAGPHPPTPSPVATGEGEQHDVSPSPAAAGEGEGRRPGGEGLRAFLSERLPSYMIPAAFVFLDALPLTPSGKLDRRALPAPERQSSDVGLVAPRTPAEAMIAEVWSAALGIEQIGVHDNFFALGGHSILATQIIGRLKQIFSLDLPLRLLFEAPTIAAFAARLATQQANATVPLQPVPRAGAPLPLSFAQQRLWFLDQLQPNSAAYNLLTVAQLTGALDLAALRHSLTAIVQRHEVLRTTFTQNHGGQSGEPVQVIAPALDVPLSVVSLLDLPNIDRQATLAQIVSDEAQRPFDLQHGPLIRAQVVQIDTMEHVLLLSVHHIVSDGWSQGILLHELATLYRGFVENQPAPLDNLPIQYADYAVWQRQWLSQGEPRSVLEQQIDYWRQQLANVPPLDLPTDYPRPAIVTSRGAHAAFQIPAGLSAELQQLSRQLGGTLFMTLLAAFQVLLARYSGQTDIAVGTPVAGRVRPELEDLIGCFVNTLVLRADLGGAPRFAELVARVRTTALGAYAHQDVPFEVVVERLQPERDLSRTPLFQVMFALQNMPRAAIALPDLTLEPVAAESATAQFDLSFTLVESGDGIQGQVEYRTDLFAPETITRLVSQYQSLLAAVIADPGLSILQLPPLSEAERRMLADWNTIAAPPQTKCLPDLVAAQAAQSPDAIAVVDGDKRLSYAALNDRANQLAHHLQTIGVGPETVVGVCLLPSGDLVVALLAILKAGGVYLPLDPDTPTERLAFMLADTQASVVLTRAAHQAQLPVSPGRIVCLDSESAQIDRQPTAEPRRAIHPETLAYIIYTSGSTGQPKGVGVAHGALAGHIASIRQVYALNSQDRVLQFAAPSFDVSIEQIGGALTSGASLMIRSAELWSPQEFTAVVAQAGLTVVNLPPIYFRAWMRSFDEQASKVPPALRLVIVGGEALPVESLQRWQASDLHPIRLLNAYGPTETTITATIEDLTAESYASAKRRSVPIGRPVGGRTAYILGSDGAPVPVGIPGELCIGGHGLARSYFNRPDLTAERFVPDPFAQVPGSRLYRTGDLARYLPDGQIEFLGRVDHQVKLRGFRIELGEIEAVLRQHEAVREAAVLLRDERLVAYVVAHQEPRTKNQEPGAESSPSPAGAGEGERGDDGLRAFLSERLPSYMIPAAFMFLDALPLTPSDKLDRRALPQPDADSLKQRAEFVAPRSQTEATIASIWAEVLRIEQVSVHDNFFALGGHSLLATQVTTRIRELFQTELAVRTLFEHPTIAALSRHVEAVQWSPDDPVAAVDPADEEEEWEI